jgi:hypothetical protein
MTRVLLHPLAGVLSAFGMGLADVRALKQQAVEARLSDAALAVTAPTLDALEAAARADVAAQGIPADRIRGKRTLHLKYEGTDTTLEVGCADVANIVADFERKYRQHYGFLMPGKPLVIPAAQATALLADLPVTSLGPAGTGAAGIDNDLLLVLEGLGIRRLRDLAALPATVVRDRFGYEGERAWLLAAGHDSERIEPRAVAPALREMLALGSRLRPSRRWRTPCACCSIGCSHAPSGRGARRARCASVRAWPAADRGRSTCRCASRAPTASCSSWSQRPG